MFRAKRWGGLTRIVKHQTTPLSCIFYSLDDSMVSSLLVKFADCTLFRGLSGIDQTSGNLYTDLKFISTRNSCCIGTVNPRSE